MKTGTVVIAVALAAVIALVAYFAFTAGERSAAHVADPAAQVATPAPRAVTTSPRPATPRASPSATPAPVPSAPVADAPPVDAPAAPKPETPPATAPRPAGRAPETDADRRARIDKMTREYLDTMKVPPTVAAEARTLNVSDAALRAMYGAELLLHYLRQSPEAAQQPDHNALKQATDDALADLASRGDEGFLAVAANARGNPQNWSDIVSMTKATWRPGLESTLIDWLKAAPATATVSAPLRALAAIDTPDVRAFLRGSLVTYRQHASNFAAAAVSLADLHDGDAAAQIAAPLRDGNWSALRPSLLDSLGRMGGDEAKRVLVEYLRDPDGASESAALEALARIDPAAAKAEAAALLDGTSPNKLAGEEATRVKRLAAKW